MAKCTTGEKYICIRVWVKGCIIKQCSVDAKKKKKVGERQIRIRMSSTQYPEDVTRYIQ